MNAVIALMIIGGVLGMMLGIAHKYLKVEVDQRIDVVTDKLPGVNCGGCGYPGCHGLAEALVEGEVQTKKEIADYLNTTPGPDGKCLQIKC